MDYLLPGFIGVVCLFGGLIYLVAWFLTLWMTVEMARQRGRRQFGWFLVALFIPLPFFAGIYLFLLGDTDKRRIEKLLEEQMYLRKHLNEDEASRITKRLLDKEENHSKYYPA